MPFARSPSILVALIAALPLAVAGCSKRACFEWSEQEGACPAQDEAMEFFQGPPGCEDAIRSIDSEPDFDGELCCYDVTNGDSDEILCYDGSSSVGGAGGAGGMGGAGGSSSIATTSVSTGTGPQQCFSCASELFGGMGPLCPQASLLLEQLQTCLCSGACASSCSITGCSIPFNPDDACLSCTESEMGCAVEFNACVNDPGF